MPYRVTPQPVVPGEESGRTFKTLNLAKAWVTKGLRKQLSWANKFAHDAIAPISALIGDVDALDDSHFNEEGIVYRGAVVDPHTNTRALFVFEREDVA